MRQRQGQYEAASTAAAQERSRVTASDCFLPHDLEISEVAQLAEVFGHEPTLSAAFLARKELKHFPKQRLFVLCVRTTTNFLGRSSTERDIALVNRLVTAVKLPGRVLIISPHGQFKKLARRIMSLSGASIEVREPNQ